MKILRPQEIDITNRKIDFTDIKLSYSFDSELMCSKEAEYFDYYTNIKVNIVYVNYEEEFESTIGQVDLTTINLERAKKDSYPYYNVINDYTAEISDLLLNLVSEEDQLRLNQKIHIHFKEDDFDYYLDDDEIDTIYNNNICLIKSIIIHPNFRNKGIGKLVLENIIPRYIHQCGLFVLKPFPIECEEKTNGEINWDKSYLGNEKDKKISDLNKFYKKLKFENIKGFDKLLFINSDKYNDISELF